MINTPHLPDPPDPMPAPEDVDIDCPDCPHHFADHNDLAGCAIRDCPCTESKATLLDTDGEDE